MLLFKGMFESYHHYASPGVLSPMTLKFHTHQITSPSLPLPAPEKHPSTFYHYEYDSSRYLKEVESHSKCLL